MKKASIITIGDELLIGQILDANSAWIAQRLNECGIKVESMVSVPDQREAIVEVVKREMSWADVVVTTGGLGPTKDDITKRTLAEMFNSPMSRNEDVYEMNRRRLVELGFEYNELNQGQAVVPECCEVLLNEHGTAPGMWFESEGRILIALPGVPFEMRELLTGQVLPKLQGGVKQGFITHKTVSTVGVPESLLATQLEQWEDALPEYLHLAYLPNAGGVRLRLSIYDMDQSEALQEIKKQLEGVQEILGESYMEDPEGEVERVVVEMLVRRGARLAIAESCTGGAIVSRFTAIAGASQYLWGGVVAYDNDAKIKLLGVDPETIKREGVVSQAVVEQMAKGIRKISGADYAIATTGVAGPGGATERVSVGEVWIAVAGEKGVESERKIFGRLREQNIESTTKYAINMLRLRLLRNRLKIIQ